MSDNALVPEKLKQLLKDSSLFHQLHHALSSNCVTHISLDIFDTFLRRDCSGPSWVFEESARRLLNKGIPLPIEAEDYRFCRIEAEAQARKASMAEEICFSDIFDLIPLAVEYKKALMDEELAVERETLYLDPVIQLLLQEIKRYKLDVIFISDMYLPVDFLQHLINEKCPELGGVRIFVSSDIRCTKQSGSLFKHVMNQLNLMPHQILHIGDNIKDDVQSARQLGLAVLHFGMPEYPTQVFENEKYYRVGFPTNMEHARKLAVLSLPNNLAPEEQFFFNYGAYILGPLLSSFSKWTIHSAKRLHVKTILPLMREGGIFSDCINRQLNFNALGGEEINCQACYASRKSTYLPAVNDEKLDESVSQTLMRRNYTVKDFLCEFGIQDDRLLEVIDTPLALLEQVSLDGNSGLKLLVDVVESNRDKIRANVLNSKAILHRYLSDMIAGVPYMLVDLGGGGTIPLQISKVMSQQAAANLLLYTHQRGCGNSTSIPISSFLPITNETTKAIKKIARSPEVLEAVLVGLEGTTLGYHLAADGRVVPIQAKVNHNQQYKNNILSFEKGVQVYQLLDQFNKVSDPDFDIRLSCLRSIERLIECPLQWEVEHLGALIHEDNFGSEKKYGIINETVLERISKEGVDAFYRKFCKNISYGQRWVAWPQGAISKIDAEFMCDHVGLRESRYKHSQSIETLIELTLGYQVKDVIVYGAGEFFECLEPELMKNNIKISAVVDRKANFGTYKVMGYDVTRLSECSVADGSVFIIASMSFIDEIKRDIFASLSCRDVKILSLG